ncbi:hypothetical protein D3C85_1756290 [compost metagenome]
MVMMLMVILFLLIFITQLMVMSQLINYLFLTEVKISEKEVYNIAMGTTLFTYRMS